MIAELKTLLPDSRNNNFRERLVAHLENPENTDTVFRQKGRELLALYEKQFGVINLIYNLEE
jgi:hypothetical protein